MLHKVKNDDKGFTVVEGLLVIIALAIIVFVGYYVWHNQKDTKASNAAATTASQSKTTKSSATTAQKYVNIKEWGVKAPYGGTLNLEYTMSADSKHAGFTSTELVKLDSSCTPDYGGWIQRYAPSEDATEDGSGGMTAEQRATQSDKGSYAFINGYYYFFAHAQSACPGASLDNTQETTMQAQTNNDVKALVGNLQAE